MKFIFTSWKTWLNKPVFYSPYSQNLQVLSSLTEAKKDLLIKIYIFKIIYFFCKIPSRAY
jgi:uncharacterized membrane protein YbaN (DUF454 family)